MVSLPTEVEKIGGEDGSVLPPEYLPMLDRLNRIVQESGVPLEGNLFYYHREPNPGRRSIYSEFYLKRRNYSAFCRAGKRLLEIGFNGGHSALLALANGVEYHGVDICQHAYVKPAAEYLKSEFGERFHFYPGNSLEVMPKMLLDYPALRFDLVHVDGYHSVDVCRADIHNCLKMTLRGAWMVVDDTDIAALSEVVDQEIAAGRLIVDKPQGWQDFLRHRIAKAP